MAENCEICGRFGARKGQYFTGVYYNGKRYETLYLCPCCELKQRQHEIVEAEREKNQAARQGRII